MMGTKAHLRRFILAACGLALFAQWPVMAHANVIWPAAILESRILTWWAILAGLIVEFFFLFGVTDLRWKSLPVTLLMNFVSTALGVILIPLSGLMLTIFTGLIVSDIPRGGILARSCNIIFGALSVALAAAVNAHIEHPVVRVFTKTMAKRELFYWLWAANLVSVALAAASLIIWPLKD